MDVSIIIPYYNRKALFENQLKSLMAMDYPRERFEMVLIEDGSLDYKGRDFSDTGLNVKYVWNEKTDLKAHMPPRNLGIAVAEGEILIFLDCDQILPRDFIRNHVEFHRRHGDSVLQIGTRKEMRPNQDIERLQEAEYDPDVRLELFRALQSDGEGLLAMWANVWSHNISIRREHIERHGGFDDGFRFWGLEDQEFGLRMQRNGISIRFNPAIEVYHQYHKPAWGANAHQGWFRNFEYLLEKYPGDAQVRSIALLGKVMDPELPLSIRIHRIRDLSLVFYTKMEIVSRCIAGTRVDTACLGGLPENPSEYYMDKAVKWS